MYIVPKSTNESRCITALDNTGHSYGERRNDV